MKRYDCVDDYDRSAYGVAHPDGDWVKFEDAQNVIVSLENEIVRMRTLVHEASSSRDNARNDAAEQVQAEMAALRAEIGRLKSDRILHPK